MKVNGKNAFHWNVAFSFFFTNSNCIFRHFISFFTSQLFFFHFLKWEKWFTDPSTANRYWTAIQTGYCTHYAMYAKIERIFSILASLAFLKLLTFTNTSCSRYMCRMLSIGLCHLFSCRSTRSRFFRHSQHNTTHSLHFTSRSFFNGQVFWCKTIKKRSLPTMPTGNGWERIQLLWNIPLFKKLHESFTPFQSQVFKSQVVNLTQRTVSFIFL